MARARMLKPGFFRNEELAELPMAARLLFAGLWTLADHAGRLEDRPKRIKVDLMPFDDVDINALLDELQRKSFIVRYLANDLQNTPAIQIFKFLHHQKPHPHEPESEIPPIAKDYVESRHVITNINHDVTSVCVAVTKRPESLTESESFPSESLSESESLTESRSARFARFWRAYPKKTGKGAAEKAFTRLKPSDALLDSMLCAIAQQVDSRQWQEDLGRFIPLPATWLNQRRWEDEVAAESLLISDVGRHNQASAAAALAFMDERDRRLEHGQ